MNVDRKHKQLGMLAMLVCAILWSTGGFLIKSITWNPLFIAGARSLFSAIPVVVLMKATGRKMRVNKWTVAAAVSLAVCLLMFVVSTTYTTAANAVMLQYASPIWILLMSALFFKEKLQGKQILVVVLTAVGVVLFFMDQLGPGSVFGNVCAIIGGIGYGAMMMFSSQNADDDESRYTGIFMAHLLVAAVGIPSALFSPIVFTGKECLFVFILGIFQLGIPYVLFGYAAKYCSPLSMNMIALIEPLMNPIWVALMIGEVPGLFAFIGAAIILVVVTGWCVIEARETTPENAS